LRNTNCLEYANQVPRCHSNEQTELGALSTAIIAYSCAEFQNTSVPSLNKMPVALESLKKTSNARCITQLAVSDTHPLHQ